MTRPTALPQPAADALSHSARLSQEIQRRIVDAGGFLSFEDFMQAALYAPEFGYYSSELRKFGPQGDFVTAPELSPLFAECVANQVYEVLERLGGDCEILEFGAGSGRFAAGLLDCLKVLGVHSLRYSIVEVSAALRRRQQKTLAEHCASVPVLWRDSLPGHAEFRGLVIANEVLDAMPVRRFHKVGANDYEELGVGLRDGDFAWQARPADRALAAAIEFIERRLDATLPTDYVSELRPAVTPWIAAIADFLAEGVVLIVDYGYPRHDYYHRDRNAGTLSCHYQHRAHDDPFFHVGLQDISAAVDFSAVAHAGVSNGLTLAGFATQAHFLLGCGLEHRLAARADATARRYAEFAAQAKTLTLPGEMGEYFKAIALARGVAGAMRGFSIRDMSGHIAPGKADAH